MNKSKLNVVGWDIYDLGNNTLEPRGGYHRCALSLRHLRQWSPLCIQLSGNIKSLFYIAFIVLRHLRHCKFVFSLKERKLIYCLYLQLFGYLLSIPIKRLTVNKWHKWRKSTNNIDIKQLATPGYENRTGNDTAVSGARANELALSSSYTPMKPNQANCSSTARHSSMHTSLRCGSTLGGAK